jgi:DNA oxidative demethylase
MAARDLFEDVQARLGRDAVVLRGFGLPAAEDIAATIASLELRSPFRFMTTPGGYRMSVATTNCGSLGWTSDARGYRYGAFDPEHGGRWPAMPLMFERLAAVAAKAAGFSHFAPDACLINRYGLGAKLSLHQDRDERDLRAPIVSVSLGMTATFLFGGLTRAHPIVKVPLRHGDVVVWGGEDRLRYHGVMPLQGLPHAVLGPRRINLTFRKAS